MILLDKSKQKKIHTRDISIATYEGGPRSIIVEGVLHDQRLMDSYRPTGEQVPPGTIHHMVIRMQIGTTDLVIQAIDVEIPTAPREECSETLNCLQPVVGMPIVAGFTVKVKERVGGPKGCAHLVALLNAMAPAAVQGVWSAMSLKPMDPKLLPGAIERIKNTCILWSEDGVLMKAYKQNFGHLEKQVEG